MPVWHGKKVNHLATGHEGSLRVTQTQAQAQTQTPGQPAKLRDINMASASLIKEIERNSLRESSNPKLPGTLQWKMLSIGVQATATGDQL